MQGAGSTLFVPFSGVCKTKDVYTSFPYQLWKVMKVQASPVVFYFSMISIGLLQLSSLILTEKLSFTRKQSRSFTVYPT